MHGKHVLLTGAGGGIGSELARQLLAAGARITLVDINAQALQSLSKAAPPGAVHTEVADITDSDQRIRLLDAAMKKFSSIDILINAAGISPFGVFAEQPEQLLEKTLALNLTAPMLLARALLPDMLARNSGQIVNIGSMFGTIGFAWYTAYSASKFAMRGFSQALRRELADTGIRVTYIAPRAVRTAINSPAVEAMAKATGMQLDDPVAVAGKMLRAIRRQQKECYIGFPESLFARFNALAPAVLDQALQSRNRVASAFARTAGA